MPIGGNSGVWISSNVTVREMNPRSARGSTGGTTTMWAQQHTHPSPEHSLSESPVECLWAEKMHESGEIHWQAKISLAAMNRTSSATARRTVDPNAVSSPFILPQPRLLALLGLVLAAASLATVGQCGQFPGQTGHTSLAALSHTVNTNCILDESGFAYSSQL
jgi:hypothetical protein